MTQLEQVVEECRKQLKADREMSEKAADVRIVLPILRALGWRDADGDEMIPEYPTKRGNVDWALCRKGEPLVLLEEKAPDEQLSTHADQLYAYAKGSGVRLAVLTNGREWWLYRSTAHGEWADRRYAIVNIAEPGDESGLDLLRMFLNKSDIYNGAAYRAAVKCHKRMREESEQLPQVIAIWERMLADPDDELIEVLRKVMQEKHGISPTAQVVRRALTEAPQEGTGRPPPGAKLAAAAIQGHTLKVKYWKNVLTETARWLLPRIDRLPTRSRPGKAALINKSGNGMNEPEPLPGGYFIETGHSAQTCVRYSRWLLEYCGYSPDDLTVSWRMD